MGFQWEFLWWWCWHPLQACRCLRLLKAIPSGKAELSSLKGMGPALAVPRGSSGGTDPVGTAVDGFGLLQELGTQEGSLWRRRQLHVHAVAHTRLFPAKRIWKLLYMTCGLRFVAFSWRWWVKMKESCGTGKWTAWLLVCVVWGFICCSFPSGLLHKHHMYYCQACSIKRTFMKGNIRGNIITGTL